MDTDQKNHFSFSINMNTTLMKVIALTELPNAYQLHTDSGMHGIWVVTTPTDMYSTGDLVRVIWQEPPIAFGYLMRRASSRVPLPDRTDADALAYKSNLITQLPIDHMFAVHIPVAMRHGADIEPFLVRATHLLPVGGWNKLLEQAGIVTCFTPPRSWQFHAKQCWGVKSVYNGKTGGLNMSIKDRTRRCQLLVEYGICGDSLVNSIPHTKQGVLMYVSTTNTESASRSGDVCYETSLSLSFSALLLAYIETLSLVRRAVFEHPFHPNSGIDYPSREWDYAHVPYNKPFPVACLPNSPARNIDISQFAAKKAKMWLCAEASANPTAWTRPYPTLTPRTVYIGAVVCIRIQKHGVMTWIAAHVTDIDKDGKIQFDTPHDVDNCIGVVGSQVVFVQ